MVTTYDLLQMTYKGKKVFLTGHTGFKGSWMLTMLNILGAEVKGYALEPYTKNDLFNLIEGEIKCTSVIGDIRDRKKLAEEVISFEPDFIFHFAAQPLVRLSYSIPSETFEVNAIGTANLLDAVQLLNKKCQIILITTDKVYHNNEWDYPYRENDRLGGYDPYSASKACAELVIDSYRNSFFNLSYYEKHQKSIAVARAGNVIGGGDWSASRLIPDVVRALGKNEVINVRNPKAIRPWQHVLEPLKGYLLLGSRLLEDPLLYSQAYNFGPNIGDSLQVSSMVNLAIEKWGSGKFVNEINYDQPHEAGLLKLDISKAIAELGWKPKLTASEAVKYTIDWYKIFYNKPETLFDFTIKQVSTFLENDYTF